MKLEHRSSLAARRKFMGDFPLSIGNGLHSASDQRLNNSGLHNDCNRRHHRPADVFPAHILPYLYLGNDDTAKSLKVLNRCGIRHVINVTSNLPNYFEDDSDFHYLRIPVDDSSSQNLFQFFPEAISFIEKAHAEGCSVLVHCWAGLSRSVTVCLAYLMYVMNKPLEEAFDLLLKLNGAIAPNFHFLETLTCWERLLLKTSADRSNSSRSSINSGNSCASTATIPSISTSVSSLPSSSPSAVSIASSEASPILPKFSDSLEAYSNVCPQHRNLHILCHKTVSTPAISMNLPTAPTGFVLAGQQPSGNGYDKQEANLL